MTCRVSARAELSLRQRLSQREDRISELKDAVAVARSHQPSMHANHSRHPSTSPQHYHSDHMHQPQHRHPSDADIHTQSEAQSPRGQFQQRPKRQPEHQQDCALSLETSDTQQEEEEEEVRQTASPRGRSHHWVSSFKDHRQEGEQGGPRTSPAASPRSRSYQASRAVGSQKEQGEYVGPAVAARLPYFCPGAQAQTGQSQSASEGLLGTRVNPQTQLAEQRAKAAQNASGAGLGNIHCSFVINTQNPESVAWTLSSTSSMFKRIISMPAVIVLPRLLLFSLSYSDLYTLLRFHAMCQCSV